MPEVDRVLVYVLSTPSSKLSTPQEGNFKTPIYTKINKYDIIYFTNGSVAERLKAAVLKTVVGLPLPEVRILSLPHIFLSFGIYAKR